MTKQDAGITLASDVIFNLEEDMQEHDYYTSNTHDVKRLECALKFAYGSKFYPRLLQRILTLADLMGHCVGSARPDDIKSLKSLYAKLRNVRIVMNTYIEENPDFIKENS